MTDRNDFKTEGEVIMIPKVRLVFDRKAKAGKTDEGDVEVYIYHMGSKRYLVTGVRCRKREYRDGVVSMRADAVELNKRLQLCVRNIQSQINVMVEEDCVNIDRLTLNITDRSSDFLSWVENELHKKDIKPNTLYKQMSIIRTMRRCGVFKTFGDITIDEITKFDMALRDVSVGTRRAYHANAKKFINMAVIGELLPRNPYEKFVFPKENRATTIKYLTEDELRLLENVEVSGKMEFTRDLFLLGCYTGLRWSDIQQISIRNYEKRADADWLVGVQQKTGNNYAIILLPDARKILDKWGWNMNLIGLSLVDWHLKRLACIAGIGKMLTMHMSRHTFATMAMSKGVRMEIVSKMLGHTDIKMTQLYAKVLQRDVEEGFALLASRM